MSLSAKKWYRWLIKIAGLILTVWGGFGTIASLFAFIGTPVFLYSFFQLWPYVIVLAAGILLRVRETIKQTQI